MNVSNWGGDFKTMEWLDGGMCTTDCDTKGVAIIDNISITSST